MKKFKSLFYLFFSLLFFLAIIPISSIKVKADGLDDFVERCYTVTLDRHSDPEGFASWKGHLVNGENVGADIAYGFLFSKEYLDKNKGNEEYLTDLYMLFMGREPDEVGFNNWLTAMNAGMTKEQAFAGFANSEEFYLICDGYGITAGYFDSNFDRDKVNKVNLFVERCYKICLGRRGDKGGQEAWTNGLLNEALTGVDCAKNFIFSDEYLKKNLSDEEFVENLYLAILGRNSDPAGKENWVNTLQNGYTRDEIFAGFAESQEFLNICESYGIRRGNYAAVDIGDHQHRHNFNIKNTADYYLKEEATCTTPAEYFYSCKCGEYDYNSTFYYGEPTEHSFGFRNVSDNYLKNRATCTTPEEYYYSCLECGAIDYEHTFYVGDSLGHEWEEEGTVTQKPTSNSFGVKTYKCQRCDETCDITMPYYLAYEDDYIIVYSCPSRFNYYSSTFMGTKRSSLYFYFVVANKSDKVIDIVDNFDMMQLNGQYCDYGGFGIGGTLQPNEEIEGEGSFYDVYNLGINDMQDFDKIQYIDFSSIEVYVYDEEDITYKTGKIRLNYK